MNQQVFKMGGRLKASIAAVVAEGLLMGSVFLVLFQVLRLVFDKDAEFSDIMTATGGCWR